MTDSWLQKCNYQITKYSELWLLHDPAINWILCIYSQYKNHMKVINNAQKSLSMTRCRRAHNNFYHLQCRKFFASSVNIWNWSFVDGFSRKCPYLIKTKFDIILWMHGDSKGGCPSGDSGGVTITDWLFVRMQWRSNFDK